jgi:hypothetical protein
MSKAKLTRNEKFIFMRDLGVQEVGFHFVSCAVCGIATRPCSSVEKAADEALKFAFELVDDEGMGTVPFCKSCRESL